MYLPAHVAGVILHSIVATWNAGCVCFQGMVSWLRVTTSALCNSVARSNIYTELHKCHIMIACTNYFQIFVWNILCKYILFSPSYSNNFWNHDCARKSYNFLTMRPFRLTKSQNSVKCSKNARIYVRINSTIIINLLWNSLYLLIYFTTNKQ